MYRAAAISLTRTNQLEHHLTSTIPWRIGKIEIPSRIINSLPTREADENRKSSSMEATGLLLANGYTSLAAVAEEDEAPAAGGGHGDRRQFCDAHAAVLMAVRSNMHGPDGSIQYLR